jgi:hypothetical protein
MSFRRESIDALRPASGARNLASRMGLALGGRHSDHLCSGCPTQPDNLTETLLYVLHMATGRAPMIPLDEALRPTWLFSQTVHEGCPMSRS